MLNKRQNKEMNTLEISMGATTIAAGTILFTYIKKIKNKMKKFILRHNQK